MKLNHIFRGVIAGAFSAAALFAFIPVTAHAAATHTWDGGGADDYFSTAENWEGDIAPADGDAVIFPDTVVGTQMVQFNAPAVVSSITLGCSAAGDYYINSAHAINTLTIDTTAGDGGVISTCLTNVGSLNKIENLIAIDSSNDVAIDGGATGLELVELLGSHNVSFAGIVDLGVARPNFTGDITIINGGQLMTNDQAFGDAVNGKKTTVEDGGVLSLTCSMSPNGSIDEPISISGIGGSHGYSLRFYSDYYDTKDNHCSLTVSSLTLQTNSTVYLANYSVTTVTQFTSDSHTLSLKTGGTGYLTLPGQSAKKADPAVVTVSDNNPGANYTVQDNYIWVVTGTRGDITVNEGGVLKGTGTVGNVDVDGGTVAPGLSPGVLNTGDLTYTGGTLEEEIGGTASGQFDQVNVTGAVDLGSSVTTLTITHWNGFTPALNDSFVIINNDGVDAINGIFNGLAQGATAVVGGYTYTISYIGGTGNDVVLTVTGVPAAPTPTPSAPNTGMTMFKTNPAISLVGGLMIAAGLSLLARRQFKK